MDAIDLVQDALHVSPILSGQEKILRICVCPRIGRQPASWNPHHLIRATTQILHTLLLLCMNYLNTLNIMHRLLTDLWSEVWSKGDM